MGLQIDMSAMPPGVVDEFIKGRVARETLSILKTPRRQDIQARLHARDELRSIDGIGRPRMVVESTAYHYWGRRLGYECWSDKQFLREFERDNESVRLKAKGTRLQVGWNGEGKRFSKRYAWKPPTSAAS